MGQGGNRNQGLTEDHSKNSKLESDLVGRSLQDSSFSLQIGSYWLSASPGLASSAGSPVAREMSLIWSRFKVIVDSCMVYVS